jgi:hypothetical protein
MLAEATARELRKNKGEATAIGASNSNMLRDIEARSGMVPQAGQLEGSLISGVSGAQNNAYNQLEATASGAANMSANIPAYVKAAQAYAKYIRDQKNKGSGTGGGGYGGGGNGIPSRTMLSAGFSPMGNVLSDSRMAQDFGNPYGSIGMQPFVPTPTAPAMIPTRGSSTRNWPAASQNSGYSNNQGVRDLAPFEDVPMDFSQWTYRNPYAATQYPMGINRGMMRNRGY